MNKKLYTIITLLLLCSCGWAQIDSVQIDSVQLIPATVPYSCDFNSQGENARWILTRSGTVYATYLNHFTIGTGTSFGNNGTDKSLYISNDTLESYEANSESSHYFAERIFDFGSVPQSYVLELDWKASGGHNGTNIYAGLKVFLRDTADLLPQGAPDYSAEYLEIALDDTVWRHIRIPLANVSGLKTLQLYTWGYVNSSAREVPAAIDNIAITTATCEAPQFTVTIDSTNAIFNWQGAPTDSFLIIYRPVSADAQSNVYETVMGSSDTISGLLSNTEYIAWMAKLCDSDTSAMYFGTHFTMGCGSYVAPFEEHFASAQHCWTLDPAFSLMSNHIYTTNYLSYSSGQPVGYVDTARAISPAIDVSGLDFPYLKFSRIQSEYEGARKDLDLYYREYEEDEWHYMGTYITPTGGNEWKTDSLAIPSHSTTLQLGFFSIQHENQQLASIRLDDIYVYDGPECEVVSDVAFVGQSGDSAIIHWVSGEAYNCYVRYRTAADTNFWAETYDLGGYAVIAPLTSMMDYEVEVAAFCDSLVWVPCTFTSQVVAVNLPYFTDFAAISDRGWQLDNGTCLNHWTMGVPQQWDGAIPMSNALFITPDGSAAGYGLDNSYTTVVASKTFSMSDISTVNIEFDVLCGGSVISYRARDFLKVFFAPVSVAYPASENALAYANDTAATYAVNFSDYLSYTALNTYPYKLNLTQDSILHISVEMPNPAPNGEAKLAFVWRNDHITNGDVQPGPVISNVHVWQPDCDVVTYLQVNDIVGGHATVSWTPPTVAESFVVEYKPQGDDWNTATTLTTDSNFLVLNGLQANTNFDVRVRVDCGGTLGVGNWRYATFNTACAIVVTDSTPYVEDFSTTPECWNLAVNPNHAWMYNTYNAYLYHPYHTDGTVYEPCPVYSPLMDISAVSHPYLKFSHTQNNQIVGVMCRHSSLGSWQELGTFSTSSDADSVYLPVNGPYIQIAFYGTNYNWGYVYIDNVTVYNGPSCAPLTSISVVDVTAAAAAISWVGHSENGYIVRYRDLSDTAWSYATTTDTFFIINNLQGSTTYAVQVSGDCTEPNWFHTQFSTPLTATNLPYYTDFAPTSDRGWLLDNSSCINYWTIGTVDADNQLYGMFITQNGNTPGYDVTSTSMVTAEKLFEVGDADSILVEFDLRVGGEGFYDFIKLFIAPETSQYPASATADYNNPNYAKYGFGTNAFNFTAYNSYSTYPSHTYYFSETTGTNYVHISAKVKNPVINNPNLSRIKVVFLWKNDNMEGDQPGAIITNVSVKNPTCVPVSQLATSNVLSTTADVSWTPSGGGETNWVLEYKEASAATWTQALVSGTPSYSLSGLTPSTDYELRVKADCGNDQSIPVMVTFTTTPCDLFCPYIFILHDTYGDGWNGNAAIHVIQNGVEIAALTAVNHNLQSTPTNDTVEVELCHQEDITLEWTYGQWWQENGVTVLDPDGNVVYTGMGFGYHDSTLTTFTTNCPFIAPVVVTDSASDITQTQAMLHGHIEEYGELPILERGFEWKALSESDFTAVIATGDSMSFPLISLSPGSDYVYHAFAVTVVGTYNGNDIVFTTSEAENLCPTPSDLHVTDSSSQSLAITWTENGDAEQWNIQYRTVGGAVNSGTSNVPSYLIAGLEPGTTYEFQVQSVCDTTTSEWTEVATATTTTGIADYSRYIRIYPNPAGDFIDVECTMHNAPLGGDIEVVDVFGNVVRTVVGANNHSPLRTRIDTSDLAAGMYFVRVMTEKGVVTKAFVKQ